MPCSSAIEFAEIRCSSKIISWIWSIISGMVNVLVRAGRGAKHVGKSPRLNWANRFWRWHTMVHVPLMFLSEWHEFLSMPSLGIKKPPYDSPSLDVAEIPRVAQLPFSLCNDNGLAVRHMNKPLFPTTMSIASFNIGKLIRLRTYQHPLIMLHKSLTLAYYLPSFTLFSPSSTGRYHFSHP